MVSAAFHSASPPLVPLHSVHSGGGAGQWLVWAAGGLKNRPQWEAAQLHCVCCVCAGKPGAACEVSARPQLEPFAGWWPVPEPSATLGSEAFRKKHQVSGIIWG